MRRLDRGESFLVTRNGIPVGELTPAAGRRWLPGEIVASVFTAARPVDQDRLRSDVDRDIDPSVGFRA